MLFNIACKNNFQNRKVKKDKLLRMKSTDFAFYEDQKGAKISECSNIVEKLDDSNLTFIKRISTTSDQKQHSKSRNEMYHC